MKRLSSDQPYGSKLERRLRSQRYYVKHRQVILVAQKLEVSVHKARQLLGDAPRSNGSAAK